MTKKTDRELLESIVNDLADLKRQVRENTDMIKSLVHNSEETNTQLHNLSFAQTQMHGRLMKTATTSDIDRLAEDVNFIMKKGADHDTAIRKLSKAE